MIKIVAGLLLLSATLVGFHQDQATRPLKAEDLPTSGLRSEPGPTFTVPIQQKSPSIIVYGDQRFTDPHNTRVTNPIARRLLVERIAKENPSALLLNGDVPYSGDNLSDYQVYSDETKPWRDAHIHVFPALGNHEFRGNAEQALEHWWTAFPEMRNRRWYSVEIGKSIYSITLDSDASLEPGSDQQRWLDSQLRGVPNSTKFIFVNLHHPPVDDVQTGQNTSHNPRPNEIALRDYLEQTAPQLKAKILVCAGHVHNYERFFEHDVTYLVSGGGGASPAAIERTPEDLYQNKEFPNFHYVKFVLRDKTLYGTMYRLSKFDSAAPDFEVRDQFSLPEK